MKSIFDNPAAFAPFYDETVAVTGTRGSRVVRMTVRACVIEDGFDDPVTEGGIASCRRSYTVMVRKGDWQDETPPKIGDGIEYNGARLAVDSVDDLHGVEWTLKARSVE